MSSQKQKGHDVKRIDEKKLKKIFFNKIYQTKLSKYLVSGTTQLI